MKKDNTKEVLEEAIEELQEDFVIDEMNGLAKKIWEGQSPDLPLIERVRRIISALISKGYSLEGLKLPMQAEELTRLMKKINAN